MGELTLGRRSLASISEEIKNNIISVFETLDNFYDVVYLVAKNRHLLELSKSEKWEEKCSAIDSYRTKIEDIVGYDLVADIASDYFDDFVAYREGDVQIESTKFIQILNRLFE